MNLKITSFQPKTIPSNKITRRISYIETKNLTAFKKLLNSAIILV